MQNQYKFFLSNYKKIILIFIFFNALGITYWTLTPKVFEGTLAGYSNYLSDRKIKLILNELSFLVKKKQYEALSKTLKLDIEKIKKIGSLKVTTDFEENKSKTMAENAFTITIRTKNTALFQDFQNSIINYLNANEYVKYRVKTTQSNLLTRQKDLIAERKFVDSLKVLILTKMSQPSSKYTLEDLDLGTLAKASDEISENTSKNEVLLFQNKGIFITKELNDFSIKVWPKLSIILFIACCLSIAASLGFYIYKNMLK
jgi:hypothetical protein